MVHTWSEGVAIQKQAGGETFPDLPCHNEKYLQINLTTTRNSQEDFSNSYEKKSLRQLVHEQIQIQTYTRLAEKN